MSAWKVFLPVLVVLGLLLSGCQGEPVTTTPAVYSQYQLEYRLVADFNDIFWCDPDLYPIPREGQEQINANEQFSAIRANEAEFSAILAYLSMDNKANYTDEEKLLIYRQHKLLTGAIEITPSGNNYRFVLKVGEGQGELIEGTITTAGKITVEKREPSINSCPICLVKGTLIDTPAGSVPVERIEKGMTVWTQDRNGNRLMATVLGTGSAPVPADFEVVSLVLDDGRIVTASPGHPAADGCPLGDIKPGDRLDNAVVIAINRIPYSGGETYDILPAGETGLYWANGVLLKSTMAQ